MNHFESDSSSKFMPDGGHPSGDVLGSSFVVHSSRFVPFQSNSTEVLDAVFPIAMNAVVRRLGAWCLGTVQSAPEGAPGWRDVGWDAKTDTVRREYPWSNAAERIEVFLWLHRYTGDPSYLNAACRYADAMIGDPLRGICRDGGSASGMVWYWRECDTVMTNYTIRVAPAFLQLAKLTGNELYRKVGIESAEALLRIQTDVGMFLEGVIPDTLPPLKAEEAKKWVSPYKINSRIAYVIYTFSFLYKETGEGRWKDALERFLKPFLLLQHADGSFAEDFLVQEVGEYSATVKGHFHSYILYALSRGIELLGPRPELVCAAHRLADYMINEIAACGSHFFGDSRSRSKFEGIHWLNARPDAAAGLAWIAKVTGVRRYESAAKYLVVQAAMIQQMGDGLGGKDAMLNNALVEWRRDENGLHPAVDGFACFWLLIGCQALSDVQ